MLTEKQAYLSMIEFLNSFNKRSFSEDISLLLSYCEINLNDGKPMDPAMWQDWTNAVNRVLNPPS